MLGATSKCHMIPLCKGGAVHLELNIIDQQAQGAQLAIFLFIGNKSLKALQNLFEEMLGVMFEFKYKNLDKSEANCIEAFRKKKI